jgi:hypothetical protein
MGYRAFTSAGTALDLDKKNNTNWLRYGAHGNGQDTAFWTLGLRR